MGVMAPNMHQIPPTATGVIYVTHDLFLKTQTHTHRCTLPTRNDFSIHVVRLELFLRTFKSPEAHSPHGLDRHGLEDVHPAGCAHTEPAEEENGKEVSIQSCLPDSGCSPTPDLGPV